MEKTRRRGWRKQVFGLSVIIFAASFFVSLVPSIRAIAEGAIFKIKSAEITQLSSGVDGAISSHDDSTIVSDVTFHKLGDTATYKVVLQNTDSKDHVIETISDDNVNSHISYSYDKHANETITAGSNLDFVFEAKYVKTPNTNERQQVSKVKFSIRFTDIDEPEEVIVAPSTYDGLGASFVVLAISSLGLIVCAAIYIKNHKKAAKVLTAALVVALATAVITSVKAATVEVNSFTLTTNYGFYDKVVITYTDKNGDEQELISNYNEPANIPDQSKDGYTLTSWEDEQGNPVDPTQPITEDIKIHPIYRAHTYTIKFNGNGATGSMTDIAMTYDETKTLPANAFNFPGRTYTGWDTEANGSGVHYDDKAEVKNLTTEDNGIVTLYAQWSVNPFHINYDGNGATSGEMATTNCEYDQACQLRENAFEKSGYHFIGWKYNNNDYANQADVKNIIESGTITMVAQWEVNHYTIVFNINTDDSNASGDMADMTNLEYGQDYTLTANAFTRTGYNFGGWNTEIDGRSFGLTDAQEFHNLTTTDNAVITLYAQWDPIHYTIAFHQNSDGVTGNMSSQVFTYDEAKNLTQNAFIKNHYKFMGWTTAANGTGTKYDDRASIFNLTTEDGATIDLYAQWKERTAYLRGTVNDSWGSAGDMIRSLQGYSVATSFSHYEGEPNFDEIGTKYNMAIGSSNFPVYTWIDGGTIYWWSEAETIYAHEDSRNFFSGLKKAETIDYSGFNFSLTKNLAGFFRNTAALSTIDLSPLAAANPTTLEEMFYGSGIASVDLSPLSTTQATNMKGMFNSATALETVNLSAINTANVTDMSYLFSNSTNLKSVDFSHNNLSSVEDMSHMFYGDKKLESLNFTGVNTPNLKKMSWMFGRAKITSLDLSDLDTENVTHFDELFYYADVANLDISGFDTHNAATFGSMFTAFNAHGQVLDLSHFDTTSFNGGMYEMFYGTNASVIDLSSFDISAERAANIGMANILNISNNVETIYATEKLHLRDYSSIPDTNLNIPVDYGGQSKLVGGAGSTLRQLTSLGLSEYDKARIDDPDNGKPGMFTIKGARYIRYNGNGADNSTPYGAMTSEYLKAGGSLTKNAFVRDGYVFTGWKDADNNEYTNEQVMANLTESKTPLELYAQWKEGTATLTQGWNNTAALKRINADATSFEHWTGENPDFEAIDGEENIALSNSNFPVYAWTEDNKIYWWSEATTIYMNASSTRMFSGMEKLQSIDISQFDSSLLTSLEGMFENTTALASINFGNNFQTGNVTNFRDMFSKAKSLTELDLHTWDVSSFNMDLRKVFNGCSSLTSLNLDGWDLSHTTGADDWLAGTNSLQTFSMKGGKLPSNSRYLFQDLKATTINLDNLDTSKVTDMYMMFARAAGAIELDLHTWDVSNVQNMYQMFIGSKFTGINISGWQTTSLTNMASIFNGCTNLVSIDLSNIDTSKVEDMQGAFMNVPIATLDISAWNTSKNTSVRTMFSGMTNAETIYVGDGWSTELITGANDSATLPLSGMTNKLVGGAGTVWSDDKKNGLTYLHLDDPCDNNPGLFSKKNARYVCYYSNIPEGEANSGAKTGDYLMIEGGSLATNTFTRDGYVFSGWKDADNNEYTDEQVMTGLTESKTPLELYAQWDAAPYTVAFNANGGEVLQSTKTVTYLQPYGELPTPVKYDYTTDPNGSILGGKYSFKEWNTKADGSGDTMASSSIYENTDDTTLYAIWNGQFTVTVYNGESETPITASYGTEDIVYLNAQDVAGKQFLYWEVDGAKKAYTKNYSMRMFQGKDLTIRAIYGSESDLESQQPGTYISDIYRQYSDNKVFVRSYSYVPDGYEIVKAGVVATLDADIANGTFDDQTATYPRAASVNGSSDNYYYTWSKSNVTSGQTVYVKAYLIYKDTNGVEHTVYGDLVTATLTE